MSKGIIAAVVGAVVLIGGVATYAVVNAWGAPVQTTSGVITDIDHKPRRTCGTKKDSNGKSTTKWCDAEWAIETRFLGRTDRRTTGIRPPSWQREGARVRVHYYVGRWSKRPELTRITRG
jgi:hypothetical protein